MSNYRIRKHTNKFSERYEVQKKFFGVWYNFNNIDGYTTGYYDTEDEAREAIERHRAKATVEILTV